MEQINPKDLIGAKVRLLPNFDEVYQRAWVGSLALVKDHKVDEFGFNKVWVEWDRDDWRDNGEEDCWTYPEHFEVIEPAPSIEDFARQIAEEEERCPNCGGGSRLDDPAMERYIDAISDAFDQAAGSEGFVLIAAEHAPDPFDPTQEELIPIILSATKTDAARALLNLTLSQIAQLVTLRGPGFDKLDD